MELQPQEEYAEWIKGQQELVRELGLALQSGDMKEQPPLAEIVGRAAHRYHLYFRPSRSSFHRSFSLNSSPLMSPLERAFVWFGGMRPSLSFQVIYALAGHQIQAELEELLELGGLQADEQRRISLASLSASQLGRLSDLQTYTIREEDTVERDMANLQKNAADHSLILQLLGSDSSSLAPLDNDTSGSHGGHLNRKLVLLQEICMQADSLRLSTFSRVLDVLHNPSQKGQYLLATAKLQVALHHLGHSKAAPAVERHG